MTERELSVAADLFAETPSRIVISFSPEKEDRVKELTGDCPLLVLGRVTGDTLNITVNGEAVISTLVDELESVWKKSLGATLES